MGILIILAETGEVQGDSVAAPIAAPRDWNDEARVTVATYASTAQPGYALNVESVDRGSYRPYSRIGA